MSIRSDFIPKLEPRIPEKFSEGNWLDYEEPMVTLCQGMRGSGKSVAIDNIAEKLYNHGFLVLHLWGARSFENLYWSVNKDCEKKYKTIRKLLEFTVSTTSVIKCAKMNGMSEVEGEYYKQLMLQLGLIKTVSDEDKITNEAIEFLRGDKLHCKCNKAYPTVWIVPDYIEVSQDSLDRFNGVYWKDFEEYKKYLIDISTQDKKLLNEGKLKKIKYLRPKPLIIVKQITTPTSRQRKEIFREQFTEIILEARKQHRVVVMNPAIFEVAMDKFDTIAEIFRMIPYLMNKSGHFKPLTENDVGKPRKYWTWNQKSWHKIVIIINELRSVAPSSKQHGEKEASSSKRAIFDFIPEARHYKTWFLGDYQNPQDLYDGVRYQANIVIIKRASRNILGADWSWLFDKTEARQISKTNQLLRRYEIKNISQVEMFKKKYQKLRTYLTNTVPLIGELPSNQGYITFPTNETKRQRFDLPSFHHKTSTEDFILDTGITWTVNKDRKPQETKTVTKSERKQLIQQKKAIKQENMKKIQYIGDNEPEVN